MTTVGSALAHGTRTLAAGAVPDAARDAALLLATLLGTTRGGLAARKPDPLDPESDRRYAAWISRRAAREPLQHVLGTQEFHGLVLRCDRRALVPRQETEGLVDAVLDVAPANARVADLGTGSGCIAVALAVARPDLALHALDVSAEALALAAENAALHAVGGRIELRRGDLAEPPADWRGRMDVVVSNPPYVPAAEWSELEPEVRDHDPREALVPGPTGLEAHAALARSAPTLLREGGVLAAEVGFGQASAVQGLLLRAGFLRVAVRPDLRGIDRVVQATWPARNER